MNRSTKKNELFETSHLIVLISYTIMGAILILESLLMGWEKWALILILASIILSWVLHIGNIASKYQRMWVYSIFMMCSFFFYGIHSTSTYDLAIVMAAIMTIYTITAVKPFITLCQITYFVTMGYALAVMIVTEETFDSLVISRTIMHFIMIVMIGQLCRTIINKWGQVLEKSDDEIEELTDATERLNDFLANVSHELRTPVNAIVGLSGVCYEKEENEEIKKDIASVKEAGKRVAEQISDILDYSEIDRDKLVRNDEDYILSSVMYDIVTEINSFKNDSVELIIDIDPTVPLIMNTDVTKLKKIIKLLIINGLKFTPEGCVYVRITTLKEEYGVNLSIDVIDTGVGMTNEQLERAFDKFYQGDSGRSRQGGGLGLGLGIVSGFVSVLGGFLTIDSKEGVGTKVHVSIPQKVVDDSCCMSVKDKDKKCIGGFLHFDKYSHPVVREYYNVMVRNIVNGLGVQMHRVENAENLERMLESVKLTHLFVAEEEYNSATELLEKVADKVVVVVVCNKNFSLVPGSKARMMQKPFYCFPVVTYLNMDASERSKGNGRLMCHGIRALVVDDEPMNLTVAKSLFKRYGMIVSTAESGFESIEMCEANDYDIIFMDHMMSGMDGVEAMKRIRSLHQKNDSSIPIVALTANAMSSAKQMFLSEGFDGFVSKPVDREELERVLKSVLPKRFITYEYDDELTNIVEDKAREASENIRTFVEDVKASTPVLDRFSLLREHGVDVDKGLGYCQNDEEFYLSLIKQYFDESFEKMDVIKKAYEENDMENYEIYVHALKSTSKMIGELDLSDKAKELETAAKNKDRDYIVANHQSCMDDYARFVKTIAALLGEKLSGDRAANADNNDDIIEFDPVGQDDEILEFAPINEEN